MSRAGCTNARSELAFSLIELAACLVLLGLLGTLAALSLNGLGREAQLDEAVARAARWDRLARSHARRFDEPGHLTVDLDEQTLERAAPANDTQQASRWAAPVDCRIETFIVGTQRVRRRATILYSRHGYSPSYALAIRNKYGRTRWLLVAGLSGQTLVLTNEESVDEMLAMLGPEPD